MRLVLPSPWYCDNITNPHLWTNTTPVDQLWHFAVLVTGWYYIIFTFYISTSHSIPHYCWCYFLIFSLIEWYQKSKSLLLLRNPFSHFLVLTASIIWYLGSYVRLMVPSSGFILDAEWSLNVRPLAWLFRRRVAAQCGVSWLCCLVCAYYSRIQSDIFQSDGQWPASHYVVLVDLWKRSQFPFPNYFWTWKCKYLKNH